MSRRPFGVTLTRDRRRAEPLRPLDREGALVLHRLRVDHAHEVLVGHRDVDAIRLRVGGHALGVGEVRPDGDLLLLARAGEVDDRDGAVGLVRDEPLLAVARDRRAVRVAPGLHVLDRLRLRVDDRGAVGEVERGQQRLPVRADREVARPRDPVGAGGREVLRRRRVVGGGHLDHAVTRCRSLLRVVAEHVDDVALEPRRALRWLVVVRGRFRRARHVGGAAVGRHRDAAVHARHRDRLHDAADLLCVSAPAPLAALALAAALPGLDADDPDVVLPAPGRQRPEEAAVRRERAAGREVAELGHLPDGVQVAPAPEEELGGGGAALLLRVVHLRDDDSRRE